MSPAAETARQAPLYGLVLAGGFSRRMRRDKARLRIHGRPQVEHALKLLSAFCVEVFVSIRPEQADENTFANWPQVHDLHPGSGPLGAILSAQHLKPDVAWLVLACDLPSVDATLVADLVDRRDAGKPASCYRSSYDALPEPLCAIYEPSSGCQVAEHFAHGGRSPRHLLTNIEAQLLPQPFEGALDGVNTPQELEAARQRLQREPETRS